MHSLRAEKLSKTIKKNVIVRDVSITLNTKEVVGLLGPNGAGKTTTFYMICGLIAVSDGHVFIDDEDVTKHPLHVRSRLGIGYLPQESSIFKDLTVEENLLIAAEAAKLDKKSAEKRIENLLELFNIEPIRNRKGIRLSGGERRRAEIARALVSKPKFLLLDEPFAGVDPIAVIDIQNVIRQLLELDIGVLITDHNVRETLGICNRAYVMRSGELMAQGSAEEIATNSDVIKHYLREHFTLSADTGFFAEWILQEIFLSSDAPAYAPRRPVQIFLIKRSRSGEASPEPESAAKDQAVRYLEKLAAYTPVRYRRARRAVEGV